ncbi:MAG: DUF3320 domain-containing protein, partial [Thioalkalivibrio sp.]|nr:DUF3320 domain-containing protein [Thioalkalivibrio sp.]
DFDSYFEEVVYAALTNRGWTVHRQVGCARYRIDLAIVDPEAPGRYLLGIECDGANYHRAKTARDRDKLRQGVLQDLGWKLHRIWSTDWWTNPSRELEKLVAAIERAQDAIDPPEHLPVMIPVAPKAAPETVRFASAVAPVEASQLPIRPKERELEAYRAMPMPGRPRSQAEFYLPSNGNAIRAQINAVVEAEGPISVDLAAKRVAAMWGFERVRSRVAHQLRAHMNRAGVQIQQTPVGEYLWPASTDPSSYSRFRVPAADGTGARRAEEIPLEEVANAVLHILRDHMSAPVDELVRETGRLFGFQRTGSQVDERIRLGIRQLIDRGAMRLDGNVAGLFESGY